MTKLFIVYLWSIFMIVSCSESQGRVMTIEDTRSIILASQSIEYDYISKWDTRVNSTKTSDTTFIQKQLTTSNIHGFEFYAARNGYESFYDGENYLEIDHQEQLLVSYNEKGFLSDSFFFENKTIFSSQPSDFVLIDSTYAHGNTTISGSKYHVYTKITFAESVDGPLLTRKATFLIDQQTGYPFQLQRMTVKGASDTLQIISDTYENLTFSDHDIEFAFDEKLAHELGYGEIGSSYVKAAMESKMSQIGSKISRTKFLSIDKKEIDLLPSKAGYKSVIMFSFIGCGGCEVAMKKMNANSFAIKDEVKLYYASRFDQSAALKEYTRKKAFPFPAFSKSSGMQEQFNPFFAPTFFVLESDGTISDIFIGYGAEVETILYD